MGYSPEYAALEGDPTYLTYLAKLGGGEVLEKPSEAFAHTLRGGGSTRDLWPYLLGLAALLLPFDVGVRRLALGRRDLERAQSWVMERLPCRRPRSAVEAPLPVSRLFQAKSRVEERRAVVDTVAPETAAHLPAERTPAPTPSQEKLKDTAKKETLASQLLKQKRERREKVSF